MRRPDAELLAQLYSRRPWSVTVGRTAYPVGTLSEALNLVQSRSRQGATIATRGGTIQVSIDAQQATRLMAARRRR